VTVDDCFSCTFAVLSCIYRLMKKYIQHEFLKIAHFTATEWEHPLHSHNHFEIVFIHKGKGSHCLSGAHYPYKENSLFLLSPQDIHRFIIEEETEFTFLKFTGVYLKNIGNIQVQGEWNKDIDELLVYSNRQQSFTPSTDSAARKISQLINLILAEWRDTKDENSELIFMLIRTLFLYMKKNINYLPIKSSGVNTSKINELVNYIHNHIYEPELIQINNLAEQFGYSKHYFGLYFKEQMGVTLGEYISSYKMHLIINRLKYSLFSIKEISYELGFTDLSHFNKFFKKNKGINPSDFRKRLQAS